MRTYALWIAIVVMAGSAAAGSSPAGVDNVVYARYFTLDEGYPYYWSVERPTLTTGTLLVVKTEKPPAIPRQVAGPVLYVGDSPAWRLNQGYESGYLVVIVPGKVDLGQAPIWFGESGLPQQVDRATAQVQLALAEKAGIGPFSGERVKSALAAGGEAVKAADLRALLREEVAGLIVKYSPQEEQLARDLRAAGPELPIPATPARVDDVMYARRFTLGEGYRYIRSKERPWVTKGMLLVLKVDPALVVPRDIAMPVLYVGEQPVERLNRGNESGYVIVVVPGDVDLGTTLIWFGDPDSPHQVDSAKAKVQRGLAEAAGIKPFSAERVKSALSAGGEPMAAADMRTVLREEVAGLILKYSPQERPLAEDYRAPDLKRSSPADGADPGD
ncbi:MAG TPA: hypothetical protein VMV94_19640 [Phycisphaerae bacterium]|nr:hypothetical protein [Phycisphaerae bacterium]